VSKDEFLKEMVELAIAPSKAAATQIYNLLFNRDGLVAQVVNTGDKVQLGELGVFKVKMQPERTGRNPLTGAAITVPAHRKVSFSPSSTLKELCK
jgi:DNA-binding protein HU-beta